MRMHPLNFPTIRLAQFAGLLKSCGALFPTVIRMETVNDYRSLFRTETSGYWDNHYTFSETSPTKRKRWGGVISTDPGQCVGAFSFLYGELNNKPELKERALKILEELPSENNTILRHWASAGISAFNALESQALIHLHHEYREPKKCLECSIGQKLITHSA